VTRAGLLGAGGLALVLVWAQPVRGQVFLAAHANPGFEIGPLLVTATVTEAVTSSTPVRIVWGLVPGAGRGADLGDDLYLLWPGQISGGDPAPPEPGLVGLVERPGTRIATSGRLSLASRSTAVLGTRSAAEPVAGGAPFVTFERVSTVSGRTGVGSLIRIPWDPRFADRDRLIVLELNAHQLVRQHRSSWMRDLFLGRRYDAALSFNRVRVPPIFAIYLKRREQVVHLADEVSQLTLSFRQPQSLQLDEIIPSSAMHQQSESAKTPETVSLVLSHSEGLAPQTLQVRFGYFSGLWAVIPLVFTVGLVGLGHVAGPLVAALARRARGVMAARFHVGRPRGPLAQTTGVVLSRDALDRLRPGETTYEDVLRICGPLGEQHESLTGPERRRLVYRGRRVIPHPRRNFGWVATVSHWDIEDHEVEIDFAGDRVRDVQARMRRVRGAPAP
jgi:hypothetical protein